MMTYDVAIAGAGLAGAALGAHLGRAGAKVVLLDAGAFPRPKLCGEFLSPEGHEALARLGLGEALAGSGGEPIRVARLSTPRGRVVEAEVVGPDGLPGLGLSRDVLDHALVAAARAAGATVVERARVTGPLVEQGRVVGLTARHVVEGPLEVRAALVVAADGRHSALVRRTGTTTRSRNRFRPRYFGLKRHLRIPIDHPAATPAGTVALHLLPGGYVGACRIEGGRTNLCGLLPEALSRQERGDLDALADLHFPANPLLNDLWQSGQPAGPWKTVAGVRVERSRPSLPGILYAGDCQGTIDPLGGQGMTMALLGAELLAPFVLEALACEGSARLPHLAARHEHAWRRRFGHRIRLCRAFHHVLVRPSLIDGIAHLGNLGTRLLATAYGWTRDPAAPPDLFPSRPG